jgi:hypothetical protein
MTSDRSDASPVGRNAPTLRGLPWLGPLASTVVSVTALYVATVNIARRDF